MQRKEGTKPNLKLQKETMKTFTKAERLFPEAPRMKEPIPTVWFNLILYYILSYIVLYMSSKTERGQIFGLGQYTCNDLTVVTQS